MATASRSGAGGKIVTNRRKQRLSSTPYDRPPPPPPLRSPNWFSGVVVPSARAIASGAGKIISSMFTESESSSSEDEDFDSEQDIDSEIPDGVNTINQKNGVSPDLMPHEKSVKRTETKQIIEKLTLQETFTREECDRMVELLNSRVVGSSMRSAEGNLLFGSPDKNHEDVDIYNKVTQEAKKWFKDKKVGSISATQKGSGTSKVESGGTSPVDVARSYMKERPCWASPTRNFDDITPLSSKLFKEGVGFNYFSSSKKRSSLASGSWNIQEELQRVRAKATEVMLRTPSKKLDPLMAAYTSSGERNLGAGKRAISPQKSTYSESLKTTWPVDMLVDAGLSSDPALAALESRHYGGTNEAQPSHIDTVSKTILDSEVVCADEDMSLSKNPSVQNHDDEKHADPNSSGINGATETEVTEFMGRQQHTNGVLSSQPKSSAGIDPKQNHEQHNEENHITGSVTEKNSMTGTTNTQANTTATYTEVPIVMETDSIAGGSQNNLGVQNEELPIDVSIPSTMGELEKVAGKKQGKKPSTKPSRRGRARGL